MSEGLWLGFKEGSDDVDGAKLGSLVELVLDDGNIDGCLEGFSVNVSALCACCGSACTPSAGGAAGTVCNGTGAAGTAIAIGTAVGLVENEGIVEGRNVGA